MLHPTSVIQAEGVTATFLCQYPQAAGINWVVNGTALNQLHLIGVVDSSISLNNDINDTIITETLNITSFPSYNGTEVQCLATLLNGTVATTELSLTATLTVQGKIHLQKCLLLIGVL